MLWAITEYGFPKSEFAGALKVGGVVDRLLERTGHDRNGSRQSCVVIALYKDTVTLKAVFTRPEY
jgi:hypothetical protein